MSQPPGPRPRRFPTRAAGMQDSADRSAHQLRLAAAARDAGWDDTIVERHVANARTYDQEADGFLAGRHDGRVEDPTA
ncbi:hypothetical protein K1T35_47745 (plasmid) [Pseudonocardia sp. DSM 110487]|uniref:hypothetical protein n=1 Tax=Pseudonocardia sp. DSM 110487 TaxID=2865833 RepID=UPI001C6A3760|nr:hypothetical protein [Pseudonocardia sp. DSM 110487]QYN41045.1 hypothetical protein K1T35_47745 [Pseudonocardia sp. DSM 110487]